MSTDWLALAKTGDLDALVDLAYKGVEPGEEDSRDAIALKYLTVALDFGHEGASDMIDDMMGGTSLRFDDDQFVTGEMHLELGVAYLLGSDGLPKDLEKARAHLAEADDCAFPASIEGGEDMLDEIRAKLSKETLAVFEEVYPRESD